MEIAKQILAYTKREGACGFGVKEVSNATSVQDLINIMLTPKGVEHCMQNSYPSLDVLIPYSTLLASNNVLVEGEHKLINPRLVLIYSGNVTIEVSGYNVCEVYATNDAKVKIIAKDNSYVSIESYKDSVIKIERYDMAKIYKK